MLTKNDLKQIRSIVNEEVKAEIRAELKPIKEDIAQIRKDIKTMVSFFDREYLELRKRVEKIEEILKLHNSN